MGLVLQSRLDRIFDVALSLPQSELLRGTSIMVASFDLAPGQRARVRWFGYQLVRVLNSAVVVKLSTALGLTYAGLYEGAAGLLVPAGTPLVAASLESPSFRALNPYCFRDIGSPGTYRVFVVNNTSTHDLDVALTGTLRVYTDG